MAIDAVFYLSFLSRDEGSAPMAQRLTAGDLERFERDGYLVVENVLTESDLEPIWNAYRTRLDRMARRLFDAGSIPDAFAGLEFGERYTRIADIFPRIYESLDITLSVVEHLPPDAAMFADAAVFDLLRHRAILDVVEDVLGPKIVSKSDAASASEE